MQLNYIANASQPSSSGRTIPVIDPSDGQVFDELQRGTADDIDRAVRAARQCIDAVWSKLSAAERGRLLMRLSAKVGEHAEELAALEQRDCGKPTKQARADAAGAGALLRVLRRRLRQAARRHHPLPGRLHACFTWREPHGVTGHIIPWNYPMQIFGRSVGGALAAGNACVVKPAEDACLSLLRVAQLAAEVGFPAGAINIVTGYGHEAGDALARHPGIDHICFTGSPKVGTLVQQVAAERHCPVTLELGGKCAADRLRRRRPRRGAAGGDQRHRAERRPDLLGRLPPAGRASAIYEPLLERLGEAFGNLRVGPRGDGPGRGPADPRQPAAARLGLPVRRARWPASRWWRRARWSTKRRDTGFYQAPTLLRDVPADAPAGAGRSVRPGARRDAASTTRTQRSSWPTARSSAWSPASGRATARASCAWRKRVQQRPGLHQQLRRGRRRGAAVRRRQVTPATAAKRASRRCTASPRSRPSPSSTAEKRETACA